MSSHRSDQGVLRALGLAAGFALASVVACAGPNASQRPAVAMEDHSVAPSSTPSEAAASDSSAGDAGSDPNPANPPADLAPSYVETRFQMGTLVRIVVATEDTPDAATGVDAAFSAIDAVIAIMSEWEPDSDISRVNRSAGQGPVEVDPSLVHVLRIAARLSAASDGAFDVSWAPFRDVWCFEPDCTVPDAAALAAAVALVDHRRIALTDTPPTVNLAAPGMQIGLGSIAKGYAIDRAASALRDAGFDDFVIDAGGDIYAAGSPAPGADANATNSAAPGWTVAIAHPRRGDPIDTVTLRDAVVVTSGDYERYIEVDGTRYHHIIDVRSGMPARGTMQVTVVAADPTIADGLATAAFVLGPDPGLALLESEPGVEGLLIASDGTVHATSSWPGTLRSGTQLNLPVAP